MQCPARHGSPTNFPVHVARLTRLPSYFVEPGAIPTALLFLPEQPKMSQNVPKWGTVSCSPLAFAPDHWTPLLCSVYLHFLVFCVLAPRLLEPLGCLLHKLWYQSAAGPSVPAGGILFLNIILSPVPRQYLSHSEYSITVSANNDQFSLQTPKANFSISLGFPPPNSNLDFRVNI